MSETCGHDKLPMCKTDAHKICSGQSKLCGGESLISKYEKDIYGMVVQPEVKDASSEDGKFMAGSINMFKYSKPDAQGWREWQYDEEDKYAVAN